MPEQIHNSPPSIKRSMIVKLALASFIFIVVLVFFSGVTRFTGGGGSAFITISFLAAFMGGFLSLISPCSAAMLPVFFAYSFKQKSELVKMTFVFYLGLATIFVPLGFAASFVSSLFIKNPSALFNIAGIIFITLGVMLFFGKSFQLLPEKFRRTRGGTGIGAVYLMGILFAFASGTCAAPIIGGIFTIAAVSGNALQAILLLLTFALGMVGPLFVMAWFFDRYNFSQSKLVLGKTWRLALGGKHYNIHSTNLIASVLFIGVGILFILSKGTNAFLAVFNKFGVTGLYYDVNIKLLSATSNIPFWPFLAAIIFFIGFSYYRKKGSKNLERLERRDETHDDESRGDNPSMHNKF